MTRNAFTLLIPFLGIVLIASGVEPKKKKSGGFQSSKTTPKPTPTLASKQTPAPKTTPKASSPGPKASPASTTKKKSQKSATPAAESESANKTGENDTKEAESTKSASTKSPGGVSKPKASPVPSEPESAELSPATGPRGMLGPTVVSIEPESLVEMTQQPEWVQRLIRDALSLTAQNLGYLFGSADPAAGGMDCSGTIYYLLQKHGFKDVPRDSRGQYGWLIDKGTLRTVDELSLIHI